MSEGRNTWVDEIKYERKNFSFDIDMETLGKVKQFTNRYNINQLDQAIDCLVNIGLATVGFQNRQEVNDKFNQIGFYYDTKETPTENRITPPEETDDNVSFIAKNVDDLPKIDEENPIEDAMIDKTFDIIKKICSFSDDGNAVHYDILMEAESNGLESQKVEQAINNLKQQGQICESSHKKYKVVEVEKQDGNFFGF